MNDRTQIVITISIPSALSYSKETRSAVEKLNQNLLNGEALRIGAAQIVLLRCSTSVPGPELRFEFTGIVHNAAPDGPPAPPKPKRQREVA